jgi:hypothetical protein
MNFKGILVFSLWNLPTIYEGILVIGNPIFSINRGVGERESYTKSVILSVSRYTLISELTGSVNSVFYESYGISAHF